MSLKKILPAQDSPLARLARENGPRLIEQAIKAVVAGALVKEAVADDDDTKPSSGRPSSDKPSLAQRLVSAALVRVATKSVPGAIVIGGGLMAKTLYDRRRARGLRLSDAPR